ncbi:ABC transporter permease [Oceanospirillum sanctuarii]|uniref:ABC transporter permease n=1 Tax=Oceanospirillum sanctuarii TaxID=1434821 RepID=UPI000A36D852|nr:FtsX-like permease family protein [Oceanospirillum sanctuarii]
MTSVSSGSMKRQHAAGLPLALLLRLAWRNLWRHRKRTLITLTSIAIGFAMAVISIGIGDGSHNSMIRNAITLGEGHLAIQPKGYLEAPSNSLMIADGKGLTDQLQHPLKALAQQGIQVSAIPRISLQLLASTANNSVGVGLESVSGQAEDPRSEQLRKGLIVGDWLSEEQENGIVLGQALANKLKVRLGSKVVLMAGTQGGDTTAQLGRVRGIFQTGMDDLDSYLILAPLELGRLFLKAELTATGAQIETKTKTEIEAETAQPLTRIALFVLPAGAADQAQLLLNKAMNSSLNSRQLALLDWQTLMPDLVQFVALDDAGNYVFLLLILIMVLFGIINTVLMSVLERTREFGLLRALGLARIQLMLLVCAEAFLLSVLALLFGWLLGGGLHLVLSANGLDLSGMMGDSTAIMGTYMDPVIRPELSLNRIVQLSGGIFLVTLLSGLYPAIKASRVAPVDALKT